MKNLKWLLPASSVVASLILISACVTKDKAPPSAGWASGMQKLSDGLRILAPYIYSEKAFKDPGNDKLIRQTLREMTDVSMQLNTKNEIGQVDRDPSLYVALEELQLQLKDSNLSFRENNKAYAQSMAKLALNQCYFCHVRNEYGPALPQHNWSDASLANMTLLEKANLAVALRDYDHALVVLEEMLVNTTKVDNFFNLDQALKTYLSVSVRVKQSPDLALKTIRSVRAKEGLPFYLKTDLADWEKSLVVWQKEKKQKTRKGIADAKDLIRKGSPKGDLPANGSSYVYLLRASTILHDFMQSSPSKSSVAEASLLLGETYEYMNDLGSNYLSEYYYESCINGQPKSTLSKTCFDRLEKLVYFGFTGSSGVHVPKAVRQKLNRLKAIAL